MKNQLLILSRALLRRGRPVLPGIAAGLALLTGGCVTRPPAPPSVAVPRAFPLVFNQTSDGSDDRSKVESQEAVNAANGIWFKRPMDTAAYVRAGRLLNGALEAGQFSSAEEAMRLATMALQHALRANDTETLRSAVKFWELGYSGIRKAPLGGEVETYLLARRRLALELPDDLLNICHPEIQAILKTES